MPYRIAKLKEKMCENQLDTYLVSRSPNIRYYTGSMGGSHLLIAPDHDPLLLVSALDSYIVKDQAQGCLVEIFSQTNQVSQIADYLREASCINVGFDDLSHRFLHRLKERLPEITFIQNHEIIWGQRVVKDAGEKNLIKAAGRLADLAMNALQEKLTLGVTEYFLAAEASYAMTKEGAESHAFDFIIGSGPRSAYPHSSVTNRKIKRGDLIVVDIGATYKGYRSDITRTFIAGRPNPKQMEIYETVLRANEAAYNEMKSGAFCKYVDNVAREIIEKSGYGAEFIHSLGHGIGLEIHEPPSVSQKSMEKLEAGNIVSDEPGIYIHGYGGVRIEDTVLVTEKDPIKLTRHPRKLDEVVF